MKSDDSTGITDEFKGDIYTVTEITEAITQNLESEFPSIRVIGEVANFKAHTSGHYYLTLRDGQNLIRVVMFKRSTYAISFIPEDGMMVVVSGRVSHYGGSGQTQLVAGRIELSGRGPLELKFRKLLAQLMDEGLTDPRKKRSFPPYPGKIAVITSASGAVIRDITRTIARRWPVAAIEHIHADVQGVTAPSSIVGALRMADSMDDVDLVILARGGGTIEDLQAFNEEETARAVAESRHPVVTGIGHEIDTTICDYVSDLRAATPTAAAELVTPSLEDVKGNIDGLLEDIAVRFRDSSGRKLRLLEYILRSNAFPSIQHRIEMTSMRVDDNLDRLGEAMDIVVARSIENVKEFTSKATALMIGMSEIRRKHQHCGMDRLAANDPSMKIEVLKKVLGGKSEVLRLRMSAISAIARGGVEGMMRTMNGLGPEKVLQRGYSYCVSEDGKSVISSVGEVSVDDRILVNFIDGNARCVVKGKGEEKRWRQNRILKGPSSASRR